MIILTICFRYGISIDRRRNRVDEKLVFRVEVTLGGQHFTVDNLLST